MSFAVSDSFVASNRARVAFASRDHFLVWIDGDPNAERSVPISGRLRHQATIWPATGDWVTLREGGAAIDAIEPRRTTFSRKDPGRAVEQQVLAANIDRLFVVTGLDRDYNPRRLERYLLLAAESGAEPVILLNKADLHDDVAPFVAETQRLTAAAAVLPLSARSGWGVDSIASTMRPGETAALIGSSGAGKSTLVNALLGRQRQETHAVRESDQKGRHTTTRREMIPMPGGWMLIDMPGLRELQLWADPETLGDAFAEISDLARLCRFRDCRHEPGTPGCAVLAAGLDEDRLAGYSKLSRELEHVERQRDVRARLEQKQRDKSIHKAMRHFGKRK
jgi:ribosome biogenesis GTPase / thiamine phosphate phosphatase